MASIFWQDDLIDFDFWCLTPLSAIFQLLVDRDKMSNL
jgi:hypothetical protein